MTKKKLKKIPRFKSEADEREFWLSHDLADHFELSKAQTAIFPNLKPTTTAISLRLPGTLLAEIKVMANRQGVPYQSLMKVILAERVAQEHQLAGGPQE